MGTLKGTNSLTVSYANIQLTTVATGYQEYYVLQQELISLFDGGVNSPRHWLEELRVNGLTGGKIVYEGEDGKQNTQLCITLTDLPKLLLHLTKRGNAAAELVLDTLVGLALVQIANDAFGVKFEKEEREAWTAKRLAGKHTRRTLTDAVRDYYGEPRSQIYQQLTHLVNMKVLGKPASQLKNERGVKQTRDGLTRMELSRLEVAEDFLVRKIDAGVEPFAAVNMLVI